MLKGTKARKEVVTPFQPKVSTTFGKLSLSFVQKVTGVRTVTQANQHMQSLFVLTIPSSVETWQQKRYLEFRVSCAIFQVRPITWMILWQIIICSVTVNQTLKWRLQVIKFNELFRALGTRNILPVQRHKCAYNFQLTTIANCHQFGFLKLVTS